MLPDMDILEFGVVGLLLIVIYKLIDRIPMFNSSGRISADVANAIKSLAATMATMADESKKQTASLESLDEMHKAPYARRNNNTFRWHNDPDREKEIKQTAVHVVEIRKLLEKSDAG